MLKPSLVLCILCLSFSCTDKSHDINLQRGIDKDTAANTSLVIFADPLMVDSSHIIMYPLILPKSVYESSFSSGSGERTSYWNVVFYNTETGLQQLLTTDKKIVIYSISINGNSSSAYSDDWGNKINVYKNNIFYNVVSKDYNGNGYLDDNDPEYIFTSDKYGNNFRQLSPDGYNVRSWDAVKGTTKIILEAQRDENNDKKFNDGDKMIPMVVDITSGKLAHETFNKVYIDSLKSILIKSWKAEKK